MKINILHICNDELVFQNNHQWISIVKPISKMGGSKTWRDGLAVTYNMLAGAVAAV